MTFRVERGACSICSSSAMSTGMAILISFPRVEIAVNTMVFFGSNRCAPKCHHPVLPRPAQSKAELYHCHPIIGWRYTTASKPLSLPIKKTKSLDVSQTSDWFAGALSLAEE